MNKEEIIKVLKKYNFDKEKYIVISGAAMVLLGIKEETKDIDISTRKDYYNYLLANYNCTLEKINKNNNKVYFIDNIINFGLDYYKKDSILVSGIPVQTPKDILDLKITLKRKKDKIDIELIKKYIEGKDEK